MGCCTTRQVAWRKMLGLGTPAFLLAPRVLLHKACSPPPCRVSCPYLKKERRYNFHFRQEERNLHAYGSSRSQSSSTQIGHPFFKGNFYGGAWVAQSVERLTSAQVMISWSVSLRPVSGSVLTAQRLEPAFRLCLPLSLPLPHSCSLSLWLSKISEVYLGLKTPGGNVVDG